MSRAPPPGQTPLPSTLIGRDDDIAVLLPHLDRAATGAGGTIFLTGTGGVGKTRLAETIADEARRRRFRVASGRAFAAESGVPYALFADAFMPVLRDLDDAEIARLTSGAQPELALVIPGLDADRPRVDDPAELRGRLLWSVAEFVRNLAARQPLLLQFDDIHWADLSSLELLHFLARQTTTDKLLILCTCNDSERMRRSELHAIEHSLARLGIVHVHSVDPLSLADTQALVSDMFGVDDHVIREFAATLFAWTHGNAFFIRATLQTLIESGRLHRRADGQWLGWASAELELPASVREAIVARLGRLSVAARLVADTAAAIGRRFSHDILSAVVELPDAGVLAAIDELCRLQIIQEVTTDGELRYDFTHPLLREVTNAELGTARSRSLHARIARHLEQRYAADVDAHADELAAHFVRADADALGPKALHYLHAAGRNALARSANREALAYLGVALEHWTEAAAGAVSRTELVSDRARALMRTGQHDEAIAQWRSLLPEAPARGAGPHQHIGGSFFVVDDPDRPQADAETARLHQRIGQAFYFSARHTDALAHYRTGIELVAGSRSSAEAVLRLSAAVCLQELGRAEDALGEIQQARNIAEKIEDTSLLARVHRALLLLYVWTGPPDEARRHGHRATRLARAAGDTATEFSSIWGLAVLEGLTGDTKTMAEHVAVIERIAEQQHSPLLRLRTAELSIELAAARGEWHRGIAIGEHAIALARSLNQRTLLPRLLVWTSLIHIGRGDLDIAREYVDEAWQISEADFADDHPVDIHCVVPAHIGRAACLIAARDFSAAIAVCHRGLALADSSGYAFWAMHRLLPLLAEAHCHLWDAEGASLVEQRIRREAERLGHRVGLAWADSCRALTVWLAGDPAGATRLIRDACAALESIPMVGDAARLRRQLAGRLAETGDREGALQELRRVYDLFVQLGAEDELAKARDMFREIDARPPARSTRPDADELTDRETEIARLVAARRSNKAIAKALDISPRTVSTHVSNIFRKVGVSSRRELIDYVRTHDLG